MGGAFGSQPDPSTALGVTNKQGDKERVAER
jgi:hypothetical protein